MYRFLLIFCATVLNLHAASSNSLSQYGITWTFDQAYESGQYCNGDHWVVGPIVITEISNSWHTHGIEPSLHNDGSMLKPGTGDKQGYDFRLNSFNEKLNSGVINGKKVSADNPLNIDVHSSLISSVSWLCNSKTDKEPGCPKINGGTKQPRPVLRDAAILTIVSEAPAENSFRPAYCGKDKSARFNADKLQKDLLPKLKAVKNTPTLSDLERQVQRPWIEHVHQYLGAMVHPSNNLPNYGRQISIDIGTIGLTLLLDHEENIDTLLIGYVQIGIDLAGIADNGGSWPSNGGHHMGRKWPILFAGLMLDDQHMKNVGTWKTDFQEDLNTFYVSQAEIDMSNSSAWKPDKRATPMKYTTEHIAMPEWGIRHVKDPWADNCSWDATYRGINNNAYSGFVLAAHLMGQKKTWNHNALFDYCDRAVSFGSGSGLKSNTGKKSDYYYKVYAYGN
ncbi:MAG: hypothetical protein HRU15_06655, partial [Planctomycetes bacterium]|nr:hypothetical protein [Planctomycetota bacterium]